MHPRSLHGCLRPPKESSMKSFVILAALAFVVGCGGTSTSGGNNNTNGDGGVTGDDSGVTGDGSAGHDGGLLGDSGPPPPGSYTLTFGPVSVAAGQENTQCVVKRLGNAALMHVGSIHNVLTQGSHHLIVYRTNDTVEQPTPFDCKPFVGTLNPAKGSPLMITQKKDELLALPDGVAYTLQADQMIRLEMHYINPGSSAIMVEGQSTFIPIADAAFKYEADFLFIGDPDINVPAHSTSTLGPIFYKLPAAYATSNFFAITGHEHQFGTNVTISTAMSAADPGTSIYNVPVGCGTSRRRSSSARRSTSRRTADSSSRAIGTTPRTPPSASVSRRTRRCASSGRITTRARARRSASTPTRFRAASTSVARGASTARSSRGSDVQIAKTLLMLW